MVFLCPKLKHYDIRNNKPTLLYLQDRGTTDRTVRRSKNRYTGQDESNDEGNRSQQKTRRLLDQPGTCRLISKTTTTKDGQVTSVEKTRVVRVLSKESVTGDPRENERAREAGNPDAAFKGTLNNTFTPARQEEIISGGISGVDNFLDIAQQSDRGSLDYHPLFTPGELINMNGIYMNNHEALNYLWGASMSELGSKNGLEVTPGMALDGAGIYNVYDFFSGDSRTIFNQGNHREAIVRGYLDSRNGVSTSKDRDIEVNWTMFLTDAAGWY